MSQSVVHIASYSAPYPGNFIAALRSVDAQLRARGWRHVLLFDARARAFSWSGELAAEGLEVGFLPPPGTAATWTIAKQIVGVARSVDATLLHTNLAGYDLAAWVAQQRLKLEGRQVQLVWHLQSPIPNKRDRLFKDPLKFHVLGRSAHIIPVSHPISEDIRARGARSNHIHTIPNGVDLQHATRSVSAGRAELRAQFEFREADFVLVSFGWDPYRKGVDVMLDAVKAALASRPGLRLLLVGGERMEEFIRTHLGCHQPPDWLRIVPPRATVADFYRLADGFVLGSRKEGLPFAVCEALANGLPVVSSRIEGVEEWASGAPGIVFYEPGDAEGLRQGIAKVEGWTPAHRREMAEANRRLAEEKLSLTTWTRRLLAVYDTVL